MGVPLILNIPGLVARTGLPILIMLVEDGMNNPNDSPAVLAVTIILLVAAS